MDNRKLSNIPLILAVTLVLASYAFGDFTTECPRPCDCKWQSGNKAADCANGSLNVIPGQLSSDIQNLDLSNNPLYEITQDAFQIVGLSNLKKLVLRECSLIVIHKEGLSSLHIMIELDLSKNNLKALHPDTFKETEKLRWIYLNNNQLEKLDDGLFKNLEFLQKVELSNNKLLSLGVKTFTNVPKLIILRLDGNNLTHMKLETVSSLTTLSSLDLHNNPWRCDCNLQSFRNWVINRNLYTPPTSCAEPPQVYEKLWNELDSSDFACKPTILSPLPGTTIHPTDDNVTLSCKVIGNPVPDVNWVLNSRIIDAEFQKHADKRYVIHEDSKEMTKWVNLTIVNVRYHDRADFTCVAKSPGGIEERNVSLAITQTRPAGAAGIDYDMLPVFIGLSCGLVILLIFIVAMCFCLCRKKDSKRHLKSDMNSPNGDALIEGSVIPEMEKSLITAVNPVMKPPRRYDAPPSLTGAATEMNELNRTLLDNDSVFAPNEDESRSLDFDPPKKPHDTLSMDYVRQNYRAFPPDLLSFPPRGTQISPAASSASTVPDNTRLPPQHLGPISPIHSPIYGTNPNLFRTLPYSRSQSPFTSPMCPPVVTPRQGYVTIPRRPRVPSWSSTASNATTHILPTSEAQEPLYDNLGLRTTADGSSVLSLNKAGLEQQFSPMRGRPLPATPNSYPNQHPIYYAPIEEHEPSPSPAPAEPTYATSQRSSLASPISHHQIPMQIASSTPINPAVPQEPVNPRLSWAKSPPQVEPRKRLFNGPETGSLRKSPAKDDSMMNESALPTTNGNNTLGRNAKVPPRPPPKPKKKTSDSNEPLFEDEGEDGTEV